MAAGCCWTVGCPFNDLPVGRADQEQVRTWLEEARPPRAGLDVGELAAEPGVRLLLDAGGFDRHTFFCGQSGSRERATRSAPCWNSSSWRRRFASSSSTRTPTSCGSARSARRNGDVCSPVPAGRRGVVVRRSGTTGSDRLHVRFTDCDAEEQAAVLRLDPIRDREEYGVLVDMLEQGLESQGGRRASG